MLSARAALDRTLAARGLTRADLPPTSRIGKAVRRYGVMATPEFRRIDALPRREWDKEEHLAETVELMTEALRAPGGNQTLFPVQAVALREAHDYRGLIGGLRTGAGKTLCSFLCSVLLEVKRPVLFVPAKLRDKTDADLRDAAVHWRVPEHLQILSYEDLSNVKWCDWLLKYQPDLIVGDEAHKWKHDDTARTIRLERFLEQFPATPMVLFSGTFLSKELWDIQRLCEWALHDGSPVPRTWQDCSMWCSALDPKAKTKMAPGALTRWCVGREADSMDGLRSAVGRRLVQTPGVVLSTGEGVDCGLQIEAHLIDFPECEPAIKALKEDWIKPDDWKIVDAPARWMCEQTLALGFYYIWDPYPPTEWADAHSEWNSLCAELIKDRKNLIDSELQAWNACEQSDEQPEIWLRWRDVKDTFKEDKKPVWFSDVQVDRAAVWLEKHKGLCWTQFVAFGERLSERAGVPYYHLDARDAQGNSIVTAKRGPAIVSVQTCGEGLNLQDRWYRNLFVSPMSNGAEWEQALARTHRIKQPRDEVLADVWVSSLVNWTNLTGARAVERSVGRLSQDDQRKLIVADWILPEDRAVRRQKGFRWKPGYECRAAE